MRIAITGANGQLGQALCSQFALNHEIIPLIEGDFQLQLPRAVEQIVSTDADLIIHPAAYTNVDGCARDPDLAYRVNGLGTKYVALAAQYLGIPMVYISTNEVFSGTGGLAYTEYDLTGPINAYGWSKWVGEQAIRELLTQFYIVRVAWLFGGERNFVRTVLRLLEEPPANGLRMVTDEVANPTYAYDVAAAIGQLVHHPFYGTYHFVNSGACSRYDFAKEIARQSGHTDVPIEPITLADYQRDSTPPPQTSLANIAGAALGITLRPWQDALAEFIQAVRQG